MNGEPLPVQVSLTVTGYKSNPCVNLQTPATFRDEFTFTVVLAGTTPGPAEDCVAVIDPPESKITLDVTGLAWGTYSARVNGVDASFSL